MLVDMSLGELSPMRRDISLSEDFGRYDCCWLVLGWYVYHQVLITHFLVLLRCIVNELSPSSSITVRAYHEVIISGMSEACA